MKRWEPIKTEKKQLGGIIKFLQKVSPKLASKAKGRLLASRLRQVKDFKTPYIFPGQLGWSPAETRTVWHRTNNPNFKVKRVFEGRWDAKEHGAPKNGLWVSEKKDIGFMNDRPILVQLQQTIKKPMVQIGDIPTQGKNNMRNYILREAEQSGADAVKFQGIKDNKTSNQNVTFIFEPTISAEISPKEHGVLKSNMWVPGHRTNNPIIQESYYKPFREAWSTGKVKGNKATSYFFKQQPDQKFELVKNIEPNNYSVHFKTDRNALSYGNKMALFAKIADEIPEGALLSTYGSISKGGIHGLERFGKDFGFNQIGTRQLIMKGTQEPVIIPILQKPLFKTKK